MSEDFKFIFSEDVRLIPKSIPKIQVKDILLKKGFKASNILRISIPNSNYFEYNGDILENKKIIATFLIKAKTKSQLIKILMKHLK